MAPSPFVGCKNSELIHLTLQLGCTRGLAVPGGLLLRWASAATVSTGHEADLCLSICGCYSDRDFALLILSH